MPTIHRKSGVLHRRNQLNPLQILGSLVIDYFRWTQLTPMVLMWAFMLAMLFALFIVSNQEATWNLAGRLADLISTLPWIGPRFMEWMEAQAGDGAIDFNLGAIDFKAAILRAWAVVSAVFMAFAWLAGRLFGPFESWTLKRKLAWAALARIFHQGGPSFQKYVILSKACSLFSQNPPVTLCPIRFCATSGFTFRQILLES